MESTCPGGSSNTRAWLNSLGDLQPQSNGTFFFTSLMNFQAKKSFPGYLISRIQEVRVGTGREGWGEGEEVPKPQGQAWKRHDCNSGVPSRKKHGWMGGLGVGFCFLLGSF